MFIRIRTIKNRRYRYAEYRWREGKRVRSRSVSLGAVGGTNESWLKTQIGHRYGIPTDEELEQRNAPFENAASRTMDLDHLPNNAGSKLASNCAVASEKSNIDVPEQANTIASTDAAKESPADEGEAGSQ